MELRPVGAELFRAGGRAVGRKRHDEAERSLFAILRTCLRASQVEVCTEMSLFVQRSTKETHKHADFAERRILKPR